MIEFTNHWAKPHYHFYLLKVGWINLPVRMYAITIMGLGIIYLPKR